MAPRNKDNDIGLAPDTPVRAKYARDFYSWLRSRRASSAKAAWTNSTATTGGGDRILGAREFNSLVSALRVLMLHMLKWDHQPERRSRSWLLRSRRSATSSTTCCRTILD